MMSDSNQYEETTPTIRRQFIKWLLGFSVVATLAGVLTPILGYLQPPRRRTSAAGSRVRVASLADLKTAGGLIVPVENQPVVLTYSQDNVYAFSAICTHLGCVSKWEPNGSYILCPCHDGRFNAQTGAVISGPPPTPLPPRDIVVDGDDVYVIA